MTIFREQSSRFLRPRSQFCHVRHQLRILGARRLLRQLEALLRPLLLALHELRDGISLQEGTVAAHLVVAAVRLVDVL